MGWLSYTDDEVQCFHPAFQAAADDALQQLGRAAEYEWIHQIRTVGQALIPDFVLRRKADKRWIGAFEIKRRRDAVDSTRNQVQAKSYAEENQGLYRQATPRYFALTNLEITIVFALNGNRPPAECVLKDGVFPSSEFRLTEAQVHRNAFTESLASIAKLMIAAAPAEFEVVWPAILDGLVNFSTGIDASSFALSEPSHAGWPLVRDYAGREASAESAFVFGLTCLMPEYLRGILLRHSHGAATSVTPLQETETSLAKEIAALRDIDFRLLFGPSLSESIRNVSNPLRERLRHFLGLLVASHVAELAASRVDAPELLDSVFNAVVPLASQDEFGKVQTDPELASVLAAFTVHQPGRVIDPCCGDGTLLSAAYDRMVRTGLSHADAMPLLEGIDADAVSVRLASLRLTLKEPALIASETECQTRYGDMFAEAAAVADASFVLMNPPFRRYEAQDARPVPPELRQHYVSAIQALGFGGPEASAGQTNLFTLFVEFVGLAASPGARLGIILDNRWYHNSYGATLRAFLKKHFRILGLVEYPHRFFFSGYNIATSILIIEKGIAADDQKVHFIRAKGDPRTSNTEHLAEAFAGIRDWPALWTCRDVLQSELQPKDGWKRHFQADLQYDFLSCGWPTLKDLFAHSRRGSLQKEGGGIGVLEFPFRRKQFGPRRKRQSEGRPYQTSVDRPLTAVENSQLAQAAKTIPEKFRGWALQNADKPSSFVLDEAAVTKDMTLEPPSLRSTPTLFRTDRSDWTPAHDAGLQEMKADSSTGAFINGIESVVNLNENVLPREQLWSALREPYAGELVLPRKMRIGHRVHVNAFATDPASRQVRLSSNFVTFADCTATAQGFDRVKSTKVIAAFLVSSFGQLQFEMEGYNREGCLAIEKAGMERLCIFDPRWITPDQRDVIIAAFDTLPYPIPTDRLSNEQPARNALDELFAAEISKRHTAFPPDALLEEVHLMLDEWLKARQP